jgi:hypothetical protein
MRVVFLPASRLRQWPCHLHHILGQLVLLKSGRAQTGAEHSAFLIASKATS